MKLRFLGVGSAFANRDQGQTNAIIRRDDGKCLLIDCGGDVRHTFFDQGYKLDDVDAVYISHLHADHIGGMEWLAFCTYFNPTLDRPTLYANYKLMHEMWDKSLRGGLESVQKKVCNLTDYFDCKPVYGNESFMWGGVRFSPVQTVHVMNGLEIVYSYGLMIDLAPGMSSITERAERRDAGEPTRVFYTADTQFAPRQLIDFYQDADLIFHDCETVAFTSRTNVHAHIDDLNQLPVELKQKMWLMHYQQMPGRDMVEVAKECGFAGFVAQGQAFDLEAFDVE